MKPLNITNFIDSITGKTPLEVIVSTKIEVKRIDDMFDKTNSKSEHYSIIRRYRESIGDFLYFLQSKQIPAGIGKEGLKKFEPVIQSLIEQKWFKPEILD